MRNLFLRRDRWIVTIILCIGMNIHVNAQTFTERIQKKVEGKGTVTIHQSKEVEQLVNDPTATGVPSQKNDEKKQMESSKENGQANKASTTGQQPSTTNGEPSSNDLQNKATHKVIGYRVQAFAGGNSRKDRQMAEQARNNIKAHFADVPVYVHFYSPRWICRVGNYRTYEEAHQMMVNLQNLGYKQASIVKGKITVQY